MAKKGLLLTNIRNDEKLQKGLWKKGVIVLSLLPFFALAGMAGRAATPVPFSLSEDNSETARINFVKGNPGVIVRMFI